MEVHTIDTPELGDRSYLVHDGEVGVVIDPQRDIERIEEQIAVAGVRLAWVLDTHLHNDFVSGGPRLARRTGALYGFAAEEHIEPDHHPLRDGDLLHVGRLHVRVVSTPGHTEHHVAYVVEQDDREPAVFSGGSLLYGSVGRTDLVDPSRTEHLAHEQYRSAHRLLAGCPEDALLYPTHGFGSFCSSSPAGDKSTGTLAEERSGNEVLTTDDEERFVAGLVRGFTAYPPYYTHVGALNHRGAPDPDMSQPARADMASLGERLGNRDWVIDIRDRVAFAGRHLRGAVNFELNENFSVYVGWIVPWDAPLTIVADSVQSLAHAKRDLSRIGFERRLTAAAWEPMEEMARQLPAASYPVTTWLDLRDALVSAGREPVIVDVRRADEYDSGHIDGAVNLPIHDLPGRTGEAPHGELWVHCASGYRASIGSSLLERDGHRVVHINDDWPPPGDLGIKIVS